MSDYFPFEIQAEIMKWLPVKSLIQFRSVSKTWKSHIDSSDFIAGYSGYQIQPHDILVSYDYRNYVSIADDHTFPQHRVSLTVPLLVNMLENSCIIGSSHGLLCLIGHYYNTSGDDRTDMAVIWNLSIRRAIPVVVPHVEMGMIYSSVLEFGVCRATTDPKIVKVTYIKSKSDIESINSIPWQVEVFTLSTGVWRHPYTSNLPRKSIEFDWSHVVVDGFLYWRAIDRRISMGGECNLIMSFDFTSEEFREINLPDNLAREDWSVSKLRESLVVVVEADDDSVICVWMMEEDGAAAKSFIKLFNVYVGTVFQAYIMGFRNSGEPLIQILEAHHPSYKLVVYDPYSKTIDNLGIDGKCECIVSPYMQTLLLLDQPNFEVYNEMETIKFLDDLVFSYGA